MDFRISEWISGFLIGYLPTVYEISIVTDPSDSCKYLHTSLSLHIASGTEWPGCTDRTLKLTILCLCLALQLVVGRE